MPKLSLINRIKGAFRKEEAAPQMTLDDIKAKLAAQLDEEGQALMALMLEHVAAVGNKPAPAAEPAAPAKADPEEPPTEPKPPEEDPALMKLLEKNPAIAKEFEKLRDGRKATAKALDKANKQISDQAEELQAEIQKRRDDEYQVLAKSMTFLPAELEDVGKMLEEADRKLSEDSQNTLAKVLSGAQVAVEKVLGERGTARGTAENDTVDSKVEAAIKKLMADSKEEITYEQAYVKVMKSDKSLRKEADESRSLVPVKE